MAAMSLLPPTLTRGRRVILVAGLPVVLALIGFAVNAWIQGILTDLAPHALVGFPVALSAPPVDGQVRLFTGQGDVQVRALGPSAASRSAGTWRPASPGPRSAIS